MNRETTSKVHKGQQGAAFKLDEEIACYCSDEEIQKLADEELVEIIYEWQRL